MASGGRIEEAEGTVGLSFIVMKAREMARARRGAHDVFIHDRTRILLWIGLGGRTYMILNLDVNNNSSQSAEILGKTQFMTQY